MSIILPPELQLNDRFLVEIVSKDDSWKPPSFSGHRIETKQVLIPQKMVAKDFIARESLY